MPGIRIDVEAERAKQNVQELRDKLRRLGKQGELTEFEVKELGARFAAMEADLRKASTPPRSAVRKKTGARNACCRPLTILVEAMGIEPTTSALRTPRSPS